MDSHYKKLSKARVGYIRIMWPQSSRLQPMTVAVFVLLTLSTVMVIMMITDIENKFLSVKPVAGINNQDDLVDIHGMKPVADINYHNDLVDIHGVKPVADINNHDDLVDIHSVKPVADINNPDDLVDIHGVKPVADINNQDDHVDNFKERNLSDLLQILIWTPFWDRDDFFVGMGQLPFIVNNCSINTCTLTRNKTLLTSSDAVLIHINNVSDLSELPGIHLPHQYWVYFNMEPPNETRPTLGQFNECFNLTMTYKLDSDITIVSGKTKLLSETQQQMQFARAPKNHAAKKTKLVVWMASHCKTPSKREWYVAELQKYIPVDIYGQCGTLKCLDRRACPKIFGKMYKFYLAFENDICIDYVTEKPWRALLKLTVPVVLGGADYSQHFPPHSYIDIRDFKSPQGLAKYLVWLDGNDAEYNKYFQWKYTHSIQHYRLGFAFCDLCSYLHTLQHTSQIKIVHDLESWHNVNTSCTSLEHHLQPTN